VDLEGEALADYAIQAGTAVSTVAERLRAARAELCQLVVNSFGACPTHGIVNCTCGASLQS
jgi:hypothetical protein